MRKTILFLFIFIALNFWGLESIEAKGLSAARPAGVSADLILKNLDQARAQSSQLQKNDRTPNALTPSEDRGSWEEAKLDRVPEVSAEQLKEFFVNIRDVRPLNDMQGRERRLTWLYPDDGCYARAEMAAQILQEKTGVAPAKIFAFGNLSVKTKNHPDGSVGWWYHVAPILKMGDQYYVFDPALHSGRPMKAKEWLDSMRDTSLQVSICKSNTYDPESNCESDSTDRDSSRAQADEESYLQLEWNRLIDLGRNPDQELGNSPPWIHEFFLHKR